VPSGIPKFHDTADGRNGGWPDEKEMSGIGMESLASGHEGPERQAQRAEEKGFVENWLEA